MADTGAGELREVRTGPVIDVRRAAVVVLGALLAACGAEAPDAPARPNVLLISIDTLRPDHLSVYGYERPTSPNLERLAERGVLFSRAFAQAPCTAPSHMTLMTGLHPEAHGVRQWSPVENTRLAPDAPTLASLLADAGYRTEAYTGGGNVRPELGFDQGFDVYECDGGQPDLIFERAQAALERLASGDEPFLLFVHSFVVHDPYIPPDDLLDAFTDPDYAGDVVGSKRVLGELSGFDRAARDQVFWSRVREDDPADVQRLRDLYDACILHADRLVGDLLRRLAELGLAEDTLVVFTADHGEEFGEHGGFRHGTTFQEVLAVPLLMAFPEGDAEAPRGVQHAGIVRLVDVLPTVLDAVGEAPPGHAQGVSFLDRIGSDRDVADEVLSQWLRGGQHALRSGDWKLLTRWREGAEVPDQALFDLRRDPEERYNLILQHPDVAERLMARLEQLRASCREQLERFEEGASVELDEATRLQLQGLGYLGK